MKNSVLLEAKELYFKRDKKSILQDVSLQLNRGDLHIVLGPNGAGKSSLLKILSGELTGELSRELSGVSGSVVFDGKNLSDYSLKELAKKRAVLAQLNYFLFPMNVFEVCALGRTPYMGSSLNIEDKKIINESLQAVELQDFTELAYSSLSGGEQQRVHIARILCQNTELLLLDEPVSALDIRFQIQLMNLLQRLVSEGKSVLCVMHDINLALRYATQLTFLKEGKIIFQGKPAEANDPELYEQVYGVSVALTQNDKGLVQINWN